MGQSSAATIVYVSFYRGDFVLHGLAVQVREHGNKIDPNTKHASGCRRRDNRVVNRRREILTALKELKFKIKFRLK